MILWGTFRVSACDTQSVVLIVHMCEKLPSPLDVIHVKPCGNCQKRPGFHESAPQTSWNTVIDLVFFLRHWFLAVVFPVFCLVSSFPFLLFHVLFWSFNPPVSCFTLHFLYLFFPPPCWLFRPPWFVSPAACYPSLSCAVERRHSSNCDVCYPSYFFFFLL